MPKTTTPAHPPVLDLVDVGVIIGRARPGDDKSPVTARTVAVYLAGSEPGGRYADHPFPAPSGHLRRAHGNDTTGVPYWTPDRVADIEEWARTRVGPGVGGGRPRATGR